MDSFSEKDVEIIQNFLPHVDTVSQQLNLSQHAIPEAIVGYFRYTFALSQLNNLFQEPQKHDDIQGFQERYFQIRKKNDMPFANDTLLRFFARSRKPEVSEEEVQTTLEQYKNDVVEVFNSIVPIAHGIMNKFTALKIDSQGYPNLAKYQGKLKGVTSKAEKAGTADSIYDEVENISNEWDELTEMLVVKPFSILALQSSEKIIKIETLEKSRQARTMGKVFLGTHEEATEMGRSIQGVDDSIYNFMMTLNEMCGGKSETLGDLRKAMGF